MSKLSNGSVASNRASGVGLRLDMAKDPKHQAREERLQVMLTPEEVAALDDFRFKTRMPSRASAIRELLKRGLAAEGFDLASTGGRSSEYGVTGSSPGGDEANGHDTSLKKR
jgi:hypothetical protein